MSYPRILLCLVFAAPWVGAQTPRSRPFVQLEFQPDLLRDQLKGYQSPLQQLAEQLVSQWKLDPKMLQDSLKALDNIPLETRNQLQKQFEKMGQGTDGRPLDIEPLKKQVESFLKDNPDVQEIVRNGLPNKGEFKLPERTTPPPVQMPTDSALSRWLRENIDPQSWEWTDRLNQSPAFRQAIQDLTRFVQNDAPAGWERFDLDLNSLSLPDWKMPDWKWPNDAFRWVRGVNLPQVNLRAPQVPSLNFGMPSAGGVNNLGWMLLFVVLAGLAMYGLYNLRYGARAGDVAAAQPAQLALEPVPFDQIAKRRELVQTFDYWVLKLLGPAAVMWHHREVAAKLNRTHPEKQSTWEALAGLYEKARYTEGEEMLTAEERGAARAHLPRLAELS